MAELEELAASLSEAGREREATIEWLRSYADRLSGGKPPSAGKDRFSLATMAAFAAVSSGSIRHAADAIERGDHLIRTRSSSGEA